jgi:hypothetical protein
MPPRTRPRHRARPDDAARLLSVTVVQDFAEGPHIFGRRLKPEVWLTASLASVLRAALVVDHHERGRAKTLSDFAALDCAQAVWLPDLSVSVGDLPQLRAVAFIDRGLCAQHASPQALRDALGLPQR